MRDILKFGVVALGMTIAALGSSAASAATCSPAISNNVTTNAGCEVGSTNNDILGTDPIQVNIDSMFGIDDWAFLAKDDGVDGVDEGANLLGLVLTGGQFSGTWSISANAFALYDSLMLVLKGGGDNYVAYLLDSVSGTYTTSFFNPNNGNGKAISHVSLYGVVAAVPVPAAGLLLLGALGGLAVLRRRRAAV